MNLINRDLHKTTLIILNIFLMIYCSFLFQIAQLNGGDYASYINRKSQSKIYMVEMFDKSPCANINNARFHF